MRFTPQGVVDTFVKFTTFYQDLDDAQLKRAHRYFYRVCFKQDMSVMLFRVDIIHLLYNMIKGPEPLDKSSSMYKDWEELVKQIIRKCVKKLEERPALITELLFSKINSTAHYLEYGYEKQTISSNPRPAAELEFKKTVEPGQEIAIAVGALLDKSQGDHIDWVKQQLSAAESERRAWEAAEKAMPSIESQDALADAGTSEEAAAKTAPPITVRPDTDARRTAMFKNPHLRLLMKLVGVERLAPTLDETPDSSWVVPSGITADTLKDSLDQINKAEFSPPIFDDDKSAADQLKRKTAPRKRAAAYDDDDIDGTGGLAGFIGEDDDSDEDATALFAPGGPTARKSTAEGKKKTLIRRRREKDNSRESDAELDDEEAKDRARKRREREREKLSKIKSEMYVHPSDDETDEERDKEFFAREEAKYKEYMSKTIGKLLGGDGSDQDEEQDAVKEKEQPKKSSLRNALSKLKSRKRKSQVVTVDSDASESTSGSARKRMRKTVLALGSDEDEEAMDVSDERSDEDDGTGGKSGEELETDDTPLTLSPSHAGEAKKMSVDTNMEGDEDEEDDMPAPVKRRPRVAAGFLVDSSDEE